MNFVNKQNNIAATLDFFHYFFEAIFKFATIFTAGYKSGKVKCVKVLADQHLGNFTGDYALGQSFDYSRFPNSRLTYEDGIVFGAASENLH